MSALSFCGYHFDDLASACGEFPECLDFGVGVWPELGADALREESNDGGIELVGFGEAAAGASEVSDLAWIDGEHRQFCAGKGGEDDGFVSAGCFQHDQGRSKLLKARGQLIEAIGIPTDCKDGARWSDVDIEVVLGNIYANEDCLLLSVLFHHPSL